MYVTQVGLPLLSWPESIVVNIGTENPDDNGEVSELREWQRHPLPDDYGVWGASGQSPGRK